MAKDAVANDGAKKARPGWTLIEIAIVLAAIAVVAAIALPAVPSWSQWRKVRQRVPALAFKEVALSTAVQGVVEALKDPVSIMVCVHLLDREVTLVVPDETPLMEVVGSLGMQLDGKWRVWGGYHGTSAFPALFCDPFVDEVRVFSPRGREPSVP